MKAEELQRAYEEWKSWVNRENVLDDGAKAVISDNPHARGSARRELETIINEDTPGLIDGNTPTDSLLRHVGPAIESYRVRAVSRFTLDPKAFLNRAYRENKDKFAENYDKISPIVRIDDEEDNGKAELIKTNDAKFNETIKYHYTALTLSKLTEDFESDSKKNAKKALDFSGKVAPIVADYFMSELISQGDNKEVAERRVKLAMEIYMVEPDKMYLAAKIVAGKAKEKFEGRFKDDDEKAKYAKKLLDIKVDRGEANYGLASEELYKIIR